MSLFKAAEHADNPPSTWRVVKSGARWALVTRGGGVLGTFGRKRDAVEGLTCGPLVNLYEKESRWYAGESVPGWKAYEA